MEAAELRIGNYVNLIAEGHEDEPDTFKWDLEDYEFYHDRMDFVKPIPITEEWLLKFGFEKIGRNFTTKDDFIVRLSLSTKTYHFGQTYEVDVKLDSIHQLQNLYFCLTNKELELCDI